MIAAVVRSCIPCTASMIARIFPPTFVVDFSGCPFELIPKPVGIRLSRELISYFGEEYGSVIVVNDDDMVFTYRLRLLI